MQDNKKIHHSPRERRLKTLQSPYACGKNHEYPKNNPRNIQQKNNHNLRIDEILSKKIPTQLNRQRIQTLEDLKQPNKLGKSSNMKLQPIKQAYKRYKNTELKYQQSSPEDSKRSKLKAFLQNSDLFINQWKIEQAQEKQQFKHKLKQVNKSSLKSPQRPAKLKSQKVSFKNIKIKDRLASPKRLTSKTFNAKSTKILANGTIQDAQLYMYKYYLENLLNSMREDRKNLIKNKKQLTKRLKSDEKQAVINSRKQLVNQIQTQLRKQEEERHKIKKEQYRLELQAQLQRQLFTDRNTQQQQKSKYIEPNPTINVLSNQRSDERAIRITNPQQETKRRKTIQRTRSLIDIELIRDSNSTVKDIKSFSKDERLKILKVIHKYDKSEENTQQQGLPKVNFKKQ